MNKEQDDEGNQATIDMRLDEVQTGFDKNLP